MPTVRSRVAAVPDRYALRVVWSAYGAVIVGAACMYARKAAEGGSAFVRWREQVRMFWFDGVNIWDKQMFPNPPIVPISMLPLMLLPSIVGGALVWFALKAALAAAAARSCSRMAEGDSGRRLSPWAEGLVLLLSLRPILSDLHHGNNNLIILALIVATLAAWRKGYDVLAGLALGLAITYKVTPALFVPYFLSKRSWRVVGSTFLGIGIFLLIVPSLVIGPEFNGRCLSMWAHRILSPFVVGDSTSPMEINQSMIGVLSRLLTKPLERTDRYEVLFNNRYFVALDPHTVARLGKAVSLVLVGLLVVLCRTRARARTDARLFGEFSLVVLTMLFVSERSWKHHYVTLLLPCTYLVCQALRPTLPRRTRAVLASCLVLSAFLMATTSSEVGGLFAAGQGHKLAQFYGMFLWAGVVLYAATAWRVRAESGASAAAGAASLPAPHVVGVGATRRAAVGRG